jgi:hypothetical protein
LRNHQSAIHEFPNISWNLKVHYHDHERKLVTDLYPEPDEASPYHPILFLFVFQILPLFIPQMSTSFMPYFVQIIHSFASDAVPIAIWLISFNLPVLNILHWTMAYSASIHNNLDFD